MIIVTGGAGFIGGNFILDWLAGNDEPVVNLDKLTYWLDLPNRYAFRFVHVSTDEVYGTLEPSAPPFTEVDPYSPNSPYAASKAASDHLMRAWHHTYNLPVITTNCGNNYGP